MQLKFYKGSLTGNHHGPDSTILRGWCIRAKKLEQFRRLSNETEMIQSYIGWRVWFYAPSGRCWHVDVMLIPTIKQCEPYLGAEKQETQR